MNNQIFYSSRSFTINDINSEGEFVETILSQGWYYWMETWVDYSGPYETEEIALKELQRYCEFLDSEPKVAS